MSETKSSAHTSLGCRGVMQSGASTTRLFRLLTTTLICIDFNSRLIRLCPTVGAFFALRRSFSTHHTLRYPKRGCSPANPRTSALKASSSARTLFL